MTGAVVTGGSVRVVPAERAAAAGLRCAVCTDRARRRHAGDDDVRQDETFLLIRRPGYVATLHARCRSRVAGR